MIAGMESNLLWATWTVSHEGVHQAASAFRPTRPSRSFADARRGARANVRKALDKLGIKTWDHFGRFCEDDFLMLYNFGETSLRELRQMLDENGIKLLGE